MNYERIYRAFIADRRTKEPGAEEYAERHHILPRCMGGGDEPENLIRLTPEDHLFAHLLLARIHGRRMWFALILMSKIPMHVGPIGRGQRASRVVAMARREHAKRQIGFKRPDVSAALRGVAKSEAHRQNLSAARKGWRDSDETRAKKSAAMRVRVYTAERNARVSAGLKGRELSHQHRSKISSRAKLLYQGADNPRYDKTIRAFVHEDGRIERMTKYELAKKHGLNRTCLNYVIAGKRRVTKGWGLYGPYEGSEPG